MDRQSSEGGSLNGSGKSSPTAVAVGRSETAVAPLERGHAPRPNRIVATFRPAAAALTLIGGLATGSALAAMLAWSTTPQVVTLEPVAVADIDAAATSLFGPTMVATVDAAKSCRRPLAFITVRPTGDTLGTLQFRSGGYVSPNIKLGRGPFRLALPFPAPVSAGAGQIFVAGNTGGAAVFLRPGVVIPPGAQDMVINVTWNPKLTCAASH